MRQQIIAGQPATRVSPGSQRAQPLRGQLGAGDKKGERRVSETTINQRPPLPTISGRSQSLNGLLDGADDENVEEGAPDVVDGRSVVGLEARSLEVLLDENDNPQQPQEEEVKKVLRPPRREERSKSVDNYLGDGRAFDSSPRTRSPSEKFCVSETMIVDEAKEMSPSLVVVTEPTDDIAYNSEEEGPLEGNGQQQQEKEASSTSTTPSNEMSRQNSTTSSEMPERKKTFINRLGKRVKSLIKK